MSRQAPSVFEGSKYFGGQSSGPQTISSWGGRGQTAPPQAAQPNHYQPQPHNSLQQTWNEFKPSYQGAGFQQQTSANQGSFMEEYSPNGSELDWFHTETQEQTDHTSNPEVQGYKEANLFVPTTPQAKPQAIVSQQGVNSFFGSHGPDLRNSPGDLYDHEGAVSESLDEESDTESRSMTTSGSTSPDDANIEPGAAWLEEEIDDTELEAVQPQTSNTEEPTATAGCHFTAFNQRDQSAHNVNQATFFDSEAPSAAVKPALSVDQSQTDGQPVEPQNSQPLFELKSNNTSGARLFGSIPNTDKASAVSFFDSPSISSVSSSLSANSADKPPAATLFEPPQIAVAPGNSNAFGGSERQNKGSSENSTIASLSESSHVPSVPNNESALEGNKFLHSESTGVPLASTFFDSPQIPSAPHGATATSSLFGASQSAPVPSSSSSFGGNKLLPDAQQPAPVFEETVKSVESSLVNRPQTFPVHENVTGFSSNEVPNMQQHTEQIAATEPTITTGEIPVSYLPQDQPDFHGNEMQSDNHQHTDPFPITQPSGSIPTSGVPATANKDIHLPPKSTTQLFPVPEQSNVLPTLGGVSASVNEGIQPPPKSTAPLFPVTEQSNVLPTSGSVSATVNEEIQLPPKSTALFFPVSEQNHFLPTPGNVSATVNEGIQPPPKSTAPFFPEPVQSNVLPAPGDLSATVNEEIQLPPKSTAPLFPEPVQSNVLPAPGDLSATVNEGIQLPPKSTAPLFPEPVQSNVLPAQAGVSATVNEEIQLPPKSTAPFFPVSKQNHFLPTPGNVSATVNEGIQHPPKSTAPLFPEPVQSNVLPAPGDLSATVNEGIQLPPKSTAPLFPEPVQSNVLPAQAGVSATVNEEIQLPPKSTAPFFPVSEQNHFLPTPGNVSATVNEGIQPPPKSTAPFFPEPEQSNVLPAPGDLSATVNEEIQLLPKSTAPLFIVPEQSSVLPNPGGVSATVNTGIQLPPKSTAPLSPVPEQSNVLPILGGVSATVNEVTQPVPTSSTSTFPVPDQSRMPPSDLLTGPGTKQSQSYPASSSPAMPVSDHPKIPPGTVPASVGKQMQYSPEPRRAASSVQAQDLPKIQPSSILDGNQTQNTPPQAASTSSRQSAEKNPTGNLSSQGREQASTLAKEDILDPSMLQHRTPRAAHKEQAQASPCTSLWTSVPSTMPKMMLVAPVPSKQKSDGLNASGTLANQEISTRESSYRDDVSKFNNASPQNNKKCTEQFEHSSAHKENPQTASRDTHSYSGRETREKDYERRDHQHRIENSDRLQKHQTERRYIHGNDHQDIRESLSENFAKTREPQGDEAADTAGLQERQDENDRGSSYRDIKGSKENVSGRRNPARDYVGNSRGSQELVHEQAGDYFGEDREDSKEPHSYHQRHDGKNIDEYSGSRQSKGLERYDTRYSAKQRDSRQSPNYPAKDNDRHSDKYSNSRQSRDHEREDSQYGEDYRGPRREYRDYPARDDDHYSDKYSNWRQYRDRERGNAQYGEDYRGPRRESQDYPARDGGRYNDEYRDSRQSKDHERRDTRYDNDYRDPRRDTQDYPARDDGHYSDSRQSKDHERWDSRYGDDYRASRESRYFGGRHDGRYSDDHRDSRKSLGVGERPGDHYHKNYSDLGYPQDYRGRGDNRREDEYRDTRYWQGRDERQDDRNERRDRRESNDHRDDREFQGHREQQDGYYGNEYRDHGELKDHQDRHRDHHGDDCRNTSRSQERLADSSKEVDPYYEHSRGSEYSVSRWQDYNRALEDNDDWYRRSSQYSQGYPDRYTPVHSGRSTPVGYYDYAGPHYANNYGYNYQWDNYWGQYQHYPNYYSGYHDYGYYYPEYADYSGYASSQDQSNLSGVDQYSAADGHQPEWQEQPALEPESVPEPARLTPVPFPRPHVPCRFGPGGLLVTVHANHPLDGQRATLDVSNVQALFTEQEQRLIKIYPGPLSRHESVRKAVIRFTSEMAEEALADYSSSVDQKQSVSVMWKFLGLLCKQNGVFSMADIAELLVLQHQEFKRQTNAAAVTARVTEQPDVESSEDNADEEQLSDVTPDHELEDYTGADHEKISPAYAEPNPLSAETRLVLYREMLITGSRKEALEFAMKGQMWGHALTLASKMDSRTFGNILARFQSSISASDPLQTVYQHMSGRQPVAVTSGDEWMLHLAAMVGNASQFPDSDRRNITFLGDTLANDGLVYAAHLCYLLAGWSIGSAVATDTKVALIGANHKLCKNPAKLFKFANFQMTEVFEYSQSLKSEEFSLPAFQFYKFLYATKLSEAGHYGQAMHYLETIAARMLLHPGQHNTVLVKQVHEMADRLQGFDEIARQSGDEGVNLEWIEMLNKLLQAKDSALVLSQDSREDTATTEGEMDPLAQSSASFFSGYDPTAAAPAAEIPPPAETAPPEPQPEIPESEGSSLQQQPSWTFEHQTSFPSSGSGTFEPQMNDNAEVPPFQPGTLPQDDFDSFQRHANPSMFKGLAVDEGPRFTQHPAPLFPPQPQFNETPKAAVPEPAFENKKEEEPKKKETKPVQNEKAANGNQGWLSGLFSKIIPKPKNEMKLPDDSKKTIYYDKDKGCWVNTEEDEADKTPLAPPPTDSQLMGGPPPPAASQLPSTQGPSGPFPGHTSRPMAVPSPQVPRIQPGGPSPASPILSAPTGSPQLPGAQTGPGSVPGGNVPNEGGTGDKGPPLPPSKFSRKAHGLGRTGARNKYVDVLNPGGQKRNVEPPPSLLPIFPTATTSLPGNFFVPQPVPSDDADDNVNSGINTPQIANPSSRPASVGSEEGVEDNAVKQRSRSSSQSSGTLSQTSAEVRSYFDHTQTQAQPPYPPQEQQYNQQYQQQQQQQRYNQQQQQFQQPDQQQFSNSYNQFYGQPTLPSQQQLPTQQQQQQQQLPPVQNQQQGQQYQFQNVDENAQPVPSAAAPMLFNPAAFQAQPMSPPMQRRGRYVRPRT